MHATDWLKFGLTFLVPYAVSTLSSVLALRDQERLLATLKAQQAKPNTASGPNPK